MLNIGKRKIYKTVIMDGTDLWSVDYICAIHRGFISGMFKKNLNVKRVDNSSMLVVTTKLTEKEYGYVEKIVETNFPGLCIFNPSIGF